MLSLRGYYGQNIDTLLISVTRLLKTFANYALMEIVSGKIGKFQQIQQSGFSRNSVFREVLNSSCYFTQVIGIIF